MLLYTYLSEIANKLAIAIKYAMSLIFVPVDLDLEGTVPQIQQHAPDHWGWWDNEMLLTRDGLWREDLPPDFLWLRGVIESLPFVSLQMIRVSSQFKPVPPHKDVYPEQVTERTYKALVKNEPCGYRMVLRGRLDAIQVNTRKGWITCPIPQVPCVYLADTTGTDHRVLDDPDRMIVYIRGVVDPVAHKQLMERSLDRWGDWAVYN